MDPGATRRALFGGAALCLLAACGSDVEHVNPVGSGGNHYRRSPCAGCFQLPRVPSTPSQRHQMGDDIERSRA
jgi:hypothetical protein